MRDQILKSVRTLAAVLPLLALAQPLAAQREDNRDGSWELSAGAGVLYVDGALAGFLGRQGFANSGSASRLVPTAVARLGYNISNSLGVSIGTGGATGSGVDYVTPFVDVTYTADLNAKTSPFLTGGTQFTRITGNGGKIHPTWGARAGVGVRSMLSENVALRLEARMGFEHYAELPGRRATYSPAVTLGISYFTAGRHRPAAAMAPPPCPVCMARTRVDTVWRTPLPTPPITIVLRDTLVLEGVNFDYDSSALTPESHWVLDRVAQQMLDPRWAGTRWEVAGHTSSIGTAEYNMALSQRRAEAVKAYLVSRGVPDSRLVARGYGETQPKYPNDSEGRNWRNRRVELRRMKP